MTRALALLLAVAPTAAQAQAPPGSEMLMVPCHLTTDLEAGLRAHYDERQTGEGATSPGIGQLWISPAGTWTFALKLQDGRTCLLGYGKHWRWTRDKPVQPQKEPS